MERVMAVLTDKEQTLMRTIGITSMSTYRASLARIVGIDLDSHRRVQESLVGNHALQLSKGPLRVGRIGLPLLPASFLAMFPLGSISNIGQIFQANQAV